jgi:hypothetical protein
VPVQTIEQELLYGDVRQKCKLPEGCDIDYLLSQLSHLLKISNGIVYPVRIKNPPYRPLIQTQVTAGREGEIDVSKQSCTVNVVDEFSAERDEDDVAEARYKQVKVTETVKYSFVSTTRSLTFDAAECAYKKS